MGILPPLIGNPYNGYINPYYWVDDHPLLYGNNGSLDPSTHQQKQQTSPAKRVGKMKYTPGSSNIAGWKMGAPD